MEQFRPAPVKPTIAADVLEMIDIRVGTIERIEEITLKVQLVRMPECLPVTGAIVEIWHCDAEGNYSGSPGDQLYFEPEFCRRIYLNEKPYDQYGDSLYTPQNDVDFGRSREAEGLLLKPIWNDNVPLEASVKVGISRSVEVL